MHNLGSSMVDLPDDLPKLERSVVRIVALDAAGHVLLLHTGDSTDASLGTCWELPGGGLNPGEDHRTAAIREFASGQPHTGSIRRHSDEPRRPPFSCCAQGGASADRCPSRPAMGQGTRLTELIGVRL